MKKRFSIQDKLVYCGIAAYFIICLFVSFTQKGTVDSGDSVMHFLFAKYSFQHTSLFFDHWAKPLFVLLSSPFSQFGFVGIKVFNSVVSTLTLIFTYLTAKKIMKENIFIIVILLCFAPLNFTITFSGLTEPLFAFFLICSIYYLVSGKEITSSVMVSFLPFVRSEGLIIIIVFAIYFLVRRKFKVLPLLLTGHVLYSIAGYFYYHDFLWVFTKIPYAKLSSTYGSGQLTNFVTQMTYVIGIPFYILFALGFIYFVTSFFYKPFRDSENNYRLKLFVIYGGFLSFFIAHSLFWYLGIFNSMGLKRVLICVIPLSAFIALDGFNFITGILIKKKSLSYIISCLLIAYIVVFPFTGNPAAIKWKKEFSMSNDQILVNEMAVFMKNNNYNDCVYYYFPPYISLALGIDPFDHSKKKELGELFENKTIPKNSVVIWDDWSAVVECGISLDKLQNDDRFKEIKTFELSKSKFVVFLTK